jgi:hypothetical protein
LPRRLDDRFVILIVKGSNKLSTSFFNNKTIVELGHRGSLHRIVVLLRYFLSWLIMLITISLYLSIFLASSSFFFVCSLVLSAALVNVVRMAAAPLVAASWGGSLFRLFLQVVVGRWGGSGSCSVLNASILLFF